MTNQEKLVRFMRAKAERLVEAVDESWFEEEIYFSILDDMSISGMRDDVWEHLVWNVRYGVCGLRDKVCPFCLEHGDGCIRCSYGRHHGICTFQTSSFSVIRRILKYKGIDSEELFSEDWYKELIEEIEKEAG